MQINSQAIELLQEVLGRSNVCLDTETVRQYGRSCSNLELTPAAVVYPRSTAHVQTVVRIANQYRLQLHPISAGKNWGYGDAAGTAQGQVIVDLSRMRQILHVDVENLFLQIEAGVTQGQLHSFLTEQGLPITADATGAGPFASIVGNTLERGFGHTRYGDHSLLTCGMTVVMPDGELVRTGIAPDYPTSKVYRNGVGPLLEGLFFQSNLGIVTELGFWVMPKIENFCAFFFTSNDIDGLERTLNKLRPLKQQGYLPSAVHIGNDLRILSARTRSPLAQDNKGGRLSAQQRAELRAKFNVPLWTGCGSFSGPAPIVKGLREHLKHELAEFSPVFLTEKTLSRLERVVSWSKRYLPLRGLEQKLEAVRNLYPLLKGIPIEAHLNGVNWRVRELNNCASTDPLKGTAGLKWISPVLPSTPSSACEVLNLMDDKYEAYGFDTLVTFTMINERALCAVSNIAYDRSIATEVSAAKACYHDLTRTLIERGYVPYRSSPEGFPLLHADNPERWKLLQKIKCALDPNHVLSPGHYIPDLKLETK